MNVQQILVVGGTIAGETIFNSLLAVVIASVIILLLLAWRFHNVPGGWRAGFQFGGSALAALLHDVFILTGIFSILGKVFDLRIGEIDSLLRDGGVDRRRFLGARHDRRLRPDPREPARQPAPLVRAGGQPEHHADRRAVDHHQLHRGARPGEPSSSPVVRR